MTYEPAAVTSNDGAGYQEPVTEDEFADWVRRSNEQTDAVIADWDSSVGFDMERRRPPPGEEETAQDDAPEEHGAPFGVPPEIFARITEAVDAMFLGDGAEAMRGLGGMIAVRISRRPRWWPEWLLPPVNMAEAMGLEVTETGNRALQLMGLSLPGTDGMIEHFQEKHL